MSKQNYTLAKCQTSSTCRWVRSGHSGSRLPSAVRSPALCMPFPYRAPLSAFRPGGLGNSHYIYGKYSISANLSWLNWHNEWWQIGLSHPHNSYHYIFNGFCLSVKNSKFNCIKAGGGMCYEFTAENRRRAAGHQLRPCLGDRTYINAHMIWDIRDNRNHREIYFFRSVLYLSRKLDGLKAKTPLKIIPWFFSISRTNHIAEILTPCKMWIFKMSLT